jgi:hypothetical protein
MASPARAFRISAFAFHVLLVVLENEFKHGLPRRSKQRRRDALGCTRMLNFRFLLCQFLLYPRRDRRSIAGQSQIGKIGYERLRSEKQTGTGFK